MKRQQIYLDHGASTPVLPQVIEAMLPFWSEVYGNPSSHHQFGHAASIALEGARETIATLLKARPEEIVFTSCGSESDNLALRGVLWNARINNRGNHLIISSIEHSAIKETAYQLQDLFGFDITVLPVDGYGRVHISELEAALRPDTALISIMAGNNEIGTLQPIKEIGQIARRNKIPFHTDAIQSIAVQAWDMQNMPIDLMSIAPHKFYGPKGVGVLYVREGIRLESSLTGGGQESGRRAGTENVAFAVGAAEALSTAIRELPQTLAHYRSLRDRLITGILAALPNDSILTGHPQQRLPHNASFAFRDISGNDLLMHLDMAGIAASSGSACKSGDPKPSATLEAVGLGPEWTKGGLRLTVGRQNSVDEIDHILSIIPPIIKKLQKLGEVLG
jgi:cysteine desulfurase